jgi:hypothetical protein
MSSPGFTAEASLHSGRGQFSTTEPVDSGAAAHLAPAQLEVPGAAPPPAAARPQIEVYGNWCGPGHAGPGTPVDAVDEACCRHDHCYCDRGYFDCSCDRALIVDLLDAVDEPGVPAAGRVAGVAIAAALAADPFCLCHRICHPSFPDVWNMDCTGAPFPVPGIPPAKLCPLPFA